MGFTRRAEALLGVQGGRIFVRGRYAACYSRRIGVRAEPFQRLANGCPHRGVAANGVAEPRCGQRLRRGAHPSVSLEVQPQKRACALESFPRRCRSYAQVITDLLKEESSTARI